MRELNKFRLIKKFSYYVVNHEWSIYLAIVLLKEIQYFKEFLSTNKFMTMLDFIISQDEYTYFFCKLLLRNTWAVVFEITHRTRNTISQKWPKIVFQSNLNYDLLLNIIIIIFNTLIDYINYISYNWSMNHVKKLCYINIIVCNCRNSVILTHIFTNNLSTV